MNNKRMAFGFILAMCSMGGGITAEAAVQTQTQSAYSNQTQQSEITQSGKASESQTASMKSKQTESSTTDSGTTLQNTNQSIIGTTGIQSITTGNHAQQGQNGKVMSKHFKTTSDTQTQINNSDQASSSQSQQTQASNGSNTSQTSTSFIQSSQTQLVKPSTPASSDSNDPSVHQAGSSTLNAGNAVVHTISTVNQGPYSYVNQMVTQWQSGYSQNQVAGYGVFDTQGHLLSDAYGIFPNATNNYTSNYENFAVNTVANVVVRAVNAWGQPIANPNATILYLRTNNANGLFLNPSSNTVIRSVVLPAGSTGVQVSYVNTGGMGLYDVLDASVNNPYLIRHPVLKVQQQGVQAKQTQSATTVGGGNSQGQTTMLTTGQLQNTSGSTSTQQETSNQKLTASQTQNLQVGNASVQETQNSSMNSSQTSTNTGTSSQTVSAAASQSETASVSGLNTLLQEQSVSVTGSLIDVAFNQQHSVKNGSVTLNQSVSVTDPASNTIPASSQTTVNITINSNEHKQVQVAADSPITFKESQSTNGSNPSQVSQSVSMEYSAAGKHYVVALS